ncbi:MAG: ABC transporter ATP-binding protein [Candidatus Promineifilaceae bacterium]|nr:ABC transporter ATP-binding protein [Candidatus Promineifilaceae bacterium]
MMTESIIHLQDVHFRWPEQDNDLLHIPELVVNKGEHLFIKGPSGSGKTTLLNLLTGINVPDSGSIMVLGTPLERLSSSRRDQFRADHLGVIFQQFNLLPYLSLLENVHLPCGFSRRKRANAGDILETALRLLAHLGIPEPLLNKPIAKLSVGQQQRTAVARALIGSPEIVIADEPTSALDSDNRERFLELLFRETAEQGSTLIFVSHDQHIANQFEHVIDLPQINLARNGEI